MEIGAYITLSIYFLGMLVIGWYAYKKSTDDISGYMLGDRGLGPAVTALSAGAADMSGWMLMGLPGEMYTTGLSGIWLAVGLTIGAYLNYLLVAPRLRTYTAVADDSITIPDFFENRFKDRTRVLRLVSALVILVFFTLYTSAGLVSGGRLFESAFDLNYVFGMFLIAAVVIAYTLFGGFLAVSLTDFVQGVIMFLALVLVPLVVLFELGGPSPIVETIKSVDPNHLDLFRGTTVIGLFSLFAWGLGYFGQPHIIVRFMAITSVKELKPARRIGMGWMIISIAGALLTGLFGLAYVTEHNITLKDPETIFILLSDVLFNSYITGFLLAAILAAIMSTISSQLLVTSSAATEDFYKTFFRRNATDKELVLIGRLSVLVIALIAVALSYTPNNTILDLVGYAWAGFGSAFGPAILLSLYWKRMTKWGALAGIIVGAIVVLTWVQMGMSDVIYEMIPGFFASLLAVIVVSLCTASPNQDVQDTFNKMKKTLKESQQK
ncbi:sodium/proline symporter PutP [Priestia endophytica]|uniref:sodium/proline symporter PutP n=1 Tax=Priestia endophytica TaxID=135735 RepID=UPI000DCA5BBF|nr:sodium/proline symporter PutP [Priestia endophytica]KAB2493277.1 sodium/proline symporter PutP [Priestia endophytica]RAS80133.1 sodium/proline symporter [Priestia endophytica]RAS86946.1 sodium/proline symporter [Priestia endophytica]